ncbi:MAG: FmdB family zinc ribbon protein [Dehalococcoidia bacterium]
MPIYEFRCRGCLEVTEVITRGISSPFDAVCGQCGSRELDRIPSRIIPRQTEATKIEQLDPRYDRWVDETMAKSRQDSQRDIAEVRQKEAKAVTDAKAQREKKKTI